MSNTTLSRLEAIRHSQNELLYQGVKFSAIVSILASIVVVGIFRPMIEFSESLFWLLAIVVAYTGRFLDSLLFNSSENKASNTLYWRVRFSVGVIFSSLVWASAMLFIYPHGHLEYQVLIVLMLGGVAAGALATLPYDRLISNTFQSIVFIAVEARILWDATEFSMELALFSLFVFGFLLACGSVVGRNYYELLCMRQDMQDNNLTLIRTTEQMAKVGYWQWDTISDEIELSENLANMWGFPDRQVNYKKCFKYIHRDDRARVSRVVEAVSDDSEEVVVEFRMFDSRIGSYRDMSQVAKSISDSHGKSYLLGTVQDVSAIKSAEQRIYDMAYYDELTGLANRASFHEYLKLQIQAAKRNARRFAIIYIDLDDFKGVNDSYGHECGDKYLQKFARHLESTTRRTDFVARMGGDEFCIILNNIGEREEVRKTAERCLDYCNSMVRIDADLVYPKLSIGIARYPDDGLKSDELVHCADLAMYSVKLNGKNSFEFYKPEMQNAQKERVKLEADLRQAIDKGEFELWYQPKISLQEGRLAGVEALIRWHHPTRGMVPPDLFINTAERLGMINEIGEWVLMTACMQLQRWKKAGVYLQMAVNISSGHFTSEGFVDFVKRSISEFDLQDGELEIEITESMSRDPDEHTRVCHNLRSTGVRIAIDDFGTGYSSLSVLGKLEVDTLKIDRSFIMGLADDETSQVMVNSIMGLSLGLGYNVVAEGIETAEQAAFLSDLGCPYVQGYYFSKPLPAGEIPEQFHNEWPTSKVA